MWMTAVGVVFLLVHLYQLDITVKQGRNKVREMLMKNAHVTDPRVIDMLVIKVQTATPELLKLQRMGVMGGVMEERDNFVPACLWSVLLQLDWFIYVRNLLIRDEAALEFSKCMSSKAAVKILSLLFIFVARLLFLTTAIKERENRCCALVYY